VGCAARLMDAADQVVELQDAYPVPRLRPRALSHAGLTFDAAWVDPDGVWVFRSQARFAPPTRTAPARAVVITPDEREHDLVLPVGPTPEAVSHGGATAVLWTLRDPQGRLVYRVLDHG